MAPKPKYAAIVPLTGPLAVRGKNPKLREGPGSSRRRRGRRDGEGNQALEAGDWHQGRSEHGPEAYNTKPSQEETDDNEEERDDDNEEENGDDNEDEIDDDNSHLSPPSSPKAPITI